MTTLQPIAASTLTATVRRLACGLRHSSLGSGRVRRLQSGGVFRRGFSVSMSAAATEPVEVCVNASITTPNSLGDCPFCQRVLLTLEEKHLPYEMKLVDVTNKPDWECLRMLFFS